MTLSLHGVLASEPVQTLHPLNTAATPIPGHNLPPPKPKFLHQRADRTPVHACTKVQDSIFALSSATLKGHSNRHPCTSHSLPVPSSTLPAFRLTLCNQHSLPPTKPVFSFQMPGQRPFTSAGYLLRGRAPQRHSAQLRRTAALPHISGLGAAWVARPALCVTQPDCLAAATKNVKPSMYWAP